MARRIPVSFTPASTESNSSVDVVATPGQAHWEPGNMLACVEAHAATPTLIKASMGMCTHVTHSFPCSVGIPQES